MHTLYFHLTLSPSFPPLNPQQHNKTQHNTTQHKQRLSSLPSCPRPHLQEQLMTCWRRHLPSLSSLQTSIPQPCTRGEGPQRTLSQPGASCWWSVWSSSRQGVPKEGASTFTMSFLTSSPHTLEEAGVRATKRVGRGMGAEGRPWEGLTRASASRPLPKTPSGFTR